MGSDQETERRRELIRLIGEQVVVVRTSDTGFGSGFLVAEDTVLTCAHVVHGHTRAQVLTPGGAIAADVVATAPEDRGSGPVYAYPDLACLRLQSPVPGIGVWLGDETPPPGDEVAVHGFSRHTLEPGEQPDTLHLVVAGRSGQFVRLQWDTVFQGFSGGPVLDLRTGRVCGLLKASRDERSPQGGWLVPVQAVRDHFPDLAADNDRAHVPGTPWCDAALGRARRQSALFGASRSARRSARGGAARSTPAQMLSQGVMPFVPRPELAELLAWCEADAEHRLRLLHAPGGAGKTRLAAEVCRTLTEQGWVAGFVEKDAPVRREWLEELADALDVGLRALVVFDYAQARIEEIVALLDHVDRHGPERIHLRLLLLARSDEPLFEALRSRVDDPVLPETSVVALPRTIATEGNAALARRAFAVFADRLDCGWLCPPGNLEARADWQDSLLDVLALALDAVLTLSHGQTWPDRGDPLERVCDHELRGWHTLVATDMPAGAALAGPHGERVSDGLLLVPTLAQGLAGPALTKLLRQVHKAAFPDRPQVDMTGVHARLRELYPAPDGRVAPLEPDRIGEILVRRVLSTPESSGKAGAYLSRILKASTSGDPAVRLLAAADTLEILARARGCTAVGRIEHHPAHAALDDALRKAIGKRPAVLLPALTVTGARLPHAEPLAALALPFLTDAGRELLETVDALLPDHPSSLSGLATVVLGRLLEPADAEFTEDRQLLRLRRLVRYSLRSEETGRRDTALAAAREAVDLSRDLFQRTERHLAEHAAALNNLSLFLNRSGATASALAEGRSAVTLYEQLLAGAPPGADGRQLLLLNTAAALSTLALLRLTDGQVHAATEEAHRSVVLCLEAQPGVRQEDILLDCLEVLAECRQRTGLLDGAVRTGGQAVALLRDLTERQPERYVGRLPTALYRHARGLIRAGSDREAYLVLREAAILLGGLPGTDPVHRATRLSALRMLTALSTEVAGFSHEQRRWQTALESLTPTGHDDP
ncbi:trypsin-like peptidase domain-containing protein [Streptomyces bambusae]|uniref:S1 family peptidase n=1 Tax=Streptomyces bambusae TaxID=1550616 RepID=UPI001CFDB4F4|nr:serine protease [Streptomyces bambusae]MCB5167503.1 trypsin-like peptidase domain-containing protein [Streptomyces bambusae]